MAEILARFKNGKGKSKSKTANRPTLHLDEMKTPDKKPRLVHSPGSRERLSRLSEESLKVQNQLKAQENVVIAESVSDYFFFLPRSS